MIPYVVMLFFTVLFASLWLAAKRGILQAVKSVSLGHDRTMQIRMSAIYLFCAFLPMYLINSLMYYVGNDYKNYIKMFSEMLNGITPDTDPGYYAIIRLVAARHLDFQFVYAICCAIGYLLLFKCIKDYSSNMAVSLLLYFCCGYFYLLGLNQIRQFVAIGLAMYAYRYIASGRLLKFASVVLLAAAFHFSALVLLPAYFILRLRLKLSHFIIAAMVLAPVNLFYNQILTFLFATFRPKYVGTAYAERSLVIDMVWGIGLYTIALLSMAYYDKLTSKNPNNRIFIHAIWISTLIVTLCSWIPESNRFAYYFTLPLIFLVPDILLSEKNKHFRFLILFVISGFFFFMIAYQRAPIWGVYPYISIFSR